MASGNLIRFHCYGISNMIYSLSACNFHIFYFNLFQPSVAFHIETSELKWGNFLVIHYAFTCRGVATKGGRQVQQIHCFLLVFRNYIDQKFHDFHHVCYSFWTIYSSFSLFFIYRAEIDYFSLDFLKRSET